MCTNTEQSLRAQSPPLSRPCCLPCLTRYRGISIIEVLLSCAIITIILYVVVTLFPMAVLELKKAHDTVAAGTIAQRLLEQMRAQPFGTLTPSATSTEQVGSTVFSITNESYLEADPHLKHLKVTVSWSTAFRGSPQTIRSSKTYETSVFRFLNP